MRGEEKRSIVVAFGGGGGGGGEGIAVCEPGMVPEAGHHPQSQSPSPQSPAPPVLPEPAPLPAERVHFQLVVRRGGHRRQTAEGEGVVYAGGVGEVSRVAVGVCHCCLLVRGGRGGGGGNVRWERIYGGGSGIVSQSRGASAWPCASRPCSVLWHILYKRGGKGGEWCGINVERVTRRMTYGVDPSGGPPRLISLFARLLPHFIPRCPTCPLPLPLQ